MPLVSRYTASGGVTWNIWQDYVVFDATLRAWGERFMDNKLAPFSEAQAALYLRTRS